MTRVRALYAPKNQNGRVVALALVVSLVVAWQTLSILEIAWRDQRLLHQRQLAVQTRQAVFSISSAVLRRFSQPGWSHSTLTLLHTEGSIRMCLNSWGRLVSDCKSSSFTQGVDVMTTIEPINVGFIDLSGDSWSYLRMTSQGASVHQTLRESVSFAVDAVHGKVRVQQRYWRKEPSSSH